MFKKKNIAICLVMLCVGCAREAEKPIKVSNTNFDVEKIFTDENGYSVYRFYDEYYRYYVTGPNVMSTQYQVLVGKTTRPESISTTTK